MEHSKRETILEAAKAGDETKLDELVSKGVNLDVQMERSHGPVSALYNLAFSGNTRGIELLIRKGANIEMTHGRRADTALHVAALREHADVVQKLIDLGANVRARNAERPHASFSIPLHLVAQHGRNGPSSVETLRRLLQHGDAAADLYIEDADGDTPLHCAAFNSTISHIMITELLHVWSTSSSEPTSSIVNLPNHKGLTPLHFAVARGNLQAVSLLLEAGARKDACDAYGATPFHYTARSGKNVGDFLKLLDAAKDVDAPASKNQFRALHYAAWNKRHDAVRLLLGHGASVNVTDTYKGDTPLHLAARRGDAQLIEMLVKQGSADVLLTNKKGELALGLAADRGYHVAAKAFVKAIREQNRQYGLKDMCSTKHSHNGASLLHYFAAYGTEEDMKWILKVVSELSTFTIDDEQIYASVEDEGTLINKCDNAKRNAVHWAAMKGNKHTLRVLAQNNAELNANMNNPQEDGFPKTPLFLALLHGHKACADELMTLMKSECTSLDAHAQDGPLDMTTARNWIESYYKQEGGKLKIKLESLMEAKLEKNKYPLCMSNKSLFSEIPVVFLALYAERDDIASFFQQNIKGEDDPVNERGKQSGRTSLHWATLLGQRKIVAQLCRISKAFRDDLVANVEDECGKTAVQYAKEMEEEEIEKELMRRGDVRAHIEVLYKERQVYVDAANAILVGAALIASVTFAGWLQPPLGYEQYYNLPEPLAPPGADAFQIYAAIQQHAGVRFFWVLNCLSFSFAIASILAGLVAVVSIPRVYIGTSVAHLRRCLPVAAALLGSSIAFVLGAFAAAGFAVLPPLFKYQALMMGITFVGAMPCVLLFIWFYHRLALLWPDWLTVLKAKIPSRPISCTGEPLPTEGADPRTPSDQNNIAVNVERSTESYKAEDYKFGKRYAYHPWEDGLNVTSLSEIEEQWVTAK